jgi:hypothetical protein
MRAPTSYCTRHNIKASLLPPCAFLFGTPWSRRVVWGVPHRARPRAPTFVPPQSTSVHTPVLDALAELHDAQRRATAHERALLSARQRTGALAGGPSPLPPSTSPALRPSTSPTLPPAALAASSGPEQDVIASPPPVLAWSVAEGGGGGGGGTPPPASPPLPASDPGPMSRALFDSLSGLMSPTLPAAARVPHLSLNDRRSRGSSATAGYVWGGPRWGVGARCPAVVTAPCCGWVIDWVQFACMHGQVLAQEATYCWTGPNDACAAWCACSLHAAVERVRSMMDDLGFSLTEEERVCVRALRARIRGREVRQAVFNSLCSDQRSRLGRLLQKCVGREK